MCICMIIERKMAMSVLFFFEGDLKQFLEEYRSSNSSCFVLSDHHSKKSYLQEECEFNLCKISRDDDGED